MDYCYKCRAPQTRVILFEVVLPDGIAKICNKCSAEENIPIIRSKFTYPGEVEKKQSVYERLKDISGIKKESYNPTLKLREKVKKEDESLRQLVERNYRDSIGFQNLKNSDLIDNFHWVVMRARRAKHITQEQLANAIHEPETAIRNIEKGIPPTSNNIINKLESFLKIRIKKRDELPKKKPEVLDIDSMKNLTISDLKEMKEQKEFGIPKEEEFLELLDEFDDEEFMGR